MTMPVQTISHTATEVSRSLSSAVSGEDAARDALLRNSDRWFHWLIGCTVLVAIGCFMEIGESSVEWLQWRWHSKSKPFQEDDARWTIPVAIIGLFFVIVGVGGEGYFEVKQASAETAIRKYDEDALAAATKAAGAAKDSASDAAADAKTAHDESSAAKTVAGEAKTAADAAGKKLDAVDSRLDSASRKLDAMEARLTWRHIDPKKRPSYIALLKPYAGSNVGFDFAASSGDQESIGFVKEVLGMLQEAGWTVSNLHNSFGTTTGLECLIPIDSPAGKALAEVMNKLPDTAVRPVKGSGSARLIFGSKTAP